MVLWDTPPSAFAEAWRMTAALWTKTLSVFAHHILIVLLYAAPPATYRAWVLLRSRPVPAWWLPSLEALFIVWRMLMLGIAIWVALTPPQLANLRAAFTNEVLLQEGLGHLGENLGNHVWIVAWQALFFFLALLLFTLLVGYGAKLWMQGQDIPADRKDVRCAALASAARNLLLAPIAMIYIVLAIHAYLV